jgi:hypothetical protein
MGCLPLSSQIFHALPMCTGAKKIRNEDGPDAMGEPTIDGTDTASHAFSMPTDMASAITGRMPFLTFFKGRVTEYAL